MQPDNSKEYTRDDLKKTAEELNKMAEGLKEASDKVMADAKEDEELPINLFLEISKICATVLNSDEMNKVFRQIASNEAIGVETSKLLLEAVNVATTMSAFYSITFYDDLLKKELSKQHDHFAKHINDLKAAYDGCRSAIMIHTNQLAEIQKSGIIEKFKQNNGV